MPDFAKRPTVQEIADQTGVDQNVVRQVVKALASQGVVAVEDPGDRISAALQPGVSTTATPTTVNPEVAPDYEITHEYDGEKG